MKTCEDTRVEPNNFMIYGHACLSLGKNQDPVLLQMPPQILALAAVETSSGSSFMGCQCLDRSQSLL